ncbi:hypothetical protein BDN72DRAFT_965189 [Pluteus cervinus]|uniref:Uncharacterized protein n=1 Tax=Pluteus cervinus TaxID=181527 RepID=A0ACD3A791_9AGAR|nr:hypothetical protein BDN72DRAFT_965189 [Pluteus cervinus]
MDEPKLPEDILGVIGELAESSDWDPPALRALSLVSRVFIVPCQRALFRSIIINPFSPLGGNSTAQRICTKLRDLLRNNERLRNCVREIHFIQGYFSDLMESWLIGDVAAEILGVLSTRPIHRISVVFPSALDTPRRRWEDLSSSFHDALYKIFDNPQFRQLTLVNLESIPRHLPSRFPNIRYLTLEAVTFTTMPVGTDWITALAPSGLQHLDLVYGAHAGHLHGPDQMDPIPNLDMNGIYSFTLSLPDTPINDLDVAPLLRLQHLKVLHIHFTSSVRSSYASTGSWGMDLSALTSLEELTFSGKASERRDQTYVVLWDKALHRCLSAYGPSSPRRLTIVYKLVDVDPERFLDDFVRSGRVTLLSMGLSLAHKRSQGKLEEITIKLVTRDQITSSLQRKATSLLSQRPRGVFRVEFSYGPLRPPYELL